MRTRGDDVTLDLFGEPSPPQPPPPEPEPEPEVAAEPLQPSTDEGLFGALPIPDAAPEPYKRVYVHFETREDVEAFAKAIGQIVTTETREICFPAGVLNGTRYR